MGPAGIVLTGLDGVRRQTTVKRYVVWRYAYAAVLAYNRMDRVHWVGTLGLKP
jgi:translation elongation factor EF-G